MTGDFSLNRPQREDGSFMYYLQGGGDKPQICQAFQIIKGGGTTFTCFWLDVLTCEPLPEKTVFYDLSKKCISFCGTIDGVLKNFEREIWVDNKTGKPIRSCVYSQDGELIEDPSIIEPFDICDCDDIPVDELVCDTELVSEITVSRPDDTPNIGWNNENLYSGVALDDDLELCFTITSSVGNTPQMIGWELTDVNDSYQPLSNAFYPYSANGNNLLFVYENGGNQANLGSWSVGDILCIRRRKSDGQVTYYVNGSLVFTSSTMVTQPLQVGSSFYYNNGFWSEGSFGVGDVSFCQTETNESERVQNNARFSAFDKLFILSAHPELLSVWVDLDLTDLQKDILEKEGVSEQEFLKYIENERGDN